MVYVFKELACVRLSLLVAVFWLAIAAGGVAVLAQQHQQQQPGSGSDPSGDVGREAARQKSHLIELGEDNWQLMLKGEWMVEFFAPWCPACKNLAATWARFATAAADIDVNVAKIDVTISPSLSGRFFVTALPTIFHVKNGEFRQYRGSRDGEALMSFVKQKQWEKVEPISAWKKPDTIHMSILSYFFKLSHTLKDFNVRLQEEFGMPTWGSYALFAVGTIFVGAALGLLLICVVDFLYPPKKSQRQSFSESKEKGGNAVEDLANDEIEDEDQDNADNNEEDNLYKSNSAEEDVTTSTDANSNSESDEPESEKDAKNNGKSAGDATNIEEKTSSSPGDVRKRKPRKAD